MSITTTDEWSFQLSWLQRFLYTTSSLVLLVVLGSVVAGLLWASFQFHDLFAIYLGAAILMTWLSMSLFKKQSYHPGSDGHFTVRIEGASIVYGGKANQIKVDYPIAIEPGLFSCDKLIIGPGYSLPIPRQISRAQEFIESLKRSGLLTSGRLRSDSK